MSEEADILLDNDDLAESQLSTGSGVLDEHKLQRWYTCYKYLSEVPAVYAKPPCSFRVLPAVDLDTMEILPYNIDTRLPWLHLAKGVNFLGLKIPKAGVSYNFSFWLVPTDMDQYWEELGEIKIGKKRYSFQIDHCPYGLLYSALVGSGSDPNCPSEWAIMHNQTAWQRIVGDEQAWVPLKAEETHAVVQGLLLEYGGYAFDGRRQNPEPVYAALEFSKSGTFEFRHPEGLFRTLRGGNNGTGIYAYDYIVSPEEGVKLEVKLRRQQTSEGGSYNTHAVVETGVKVPMSEDAIRNNWHPFTANGQGRTPILRRLTCEEQIGILNTAFGPEIVDYAFQDTPYENLIPEDTRGSFAKFSSRYKSKPPGHWLEYVTDRYISERGDSVSEEEVEEEFEITPEKVERAKGGAQEDKVDDPPYDEEKQSSLLGQLQKEKE